MSRPTTDKIQFAKNIADAAACMDELKNTAKDPKTKKEAAGHAEFLHDLATDIAGKDAHLIYGNKEV